jgi:hypothetical protein
MKALRGIGDALKGLDQSSFFRSSGEKIELINMRRSCGWNTEKRLSYRKYCLHFAVLVTC